MFTTSRYIFLTALRDWFFIALSLATIVAVSVSFLLGSTAITEQQQMIMAYISGTTRAILLVGMTVFVCFHVRRSFDNREIELILSRPLSRSTFVFSYWLGFALLSSMMVIPLGIMVLILSWPNPLGLLFWMFSINLEAWIIVAFSLFISLILRSAVSSVLACFGFYIVTRMMGFLILLIENRPHEEISMDFFMERMLWVISIFAPRLDLFGQSRWLVYGPGVDENIWMFIIQSVIYIPLLLFMSISDLKKKQF